MDTAKVKKNLTPKIALWGTVPPFLVPETFGNNLIANNMKCLRIVLGGGYVNKPWVFRMGMVYPMYINPWMLIFLESM